MVHLKDIRNDKRLLKADILNLQETSLETHHSVPELEGYTVDVVGRGKGKGIAVYRRKEMKASVELENGYRMQMMKQEMPGLDVINVYRSGDKSLVEAAQSLAEMINKNKPTVITGDFNVCARQDKNNQITKMLRRLGFKQLVTEATQIEGRVIDHVYWKDVSDCWTGPDLERYSPYYSDHDGLLLTLRKK